MTATDTQIENATKRKPGRPATGVSPVVFSRVTPELYEAISRESAKRGVKPAAIVREAIEAVFMPLTNRAA
jgi:hypothetical protein